MLIMDASSSMLADDVGGTRMDAAKEATRDLIDSLPDTAVMGLMACGANESDAPDNHEAGCRDIEVLSPIKRLNKGAMIDKVNALRPQGYTPMGNSLRKAAEELGNDGERSIILVSDGIDTCAPPAVCDVAKELAAQGVGLAIHTVGFKVDDAARTELQCIADAGNGKFLEASDAASLADTLKFLAQRDITQYEVGGTPFTYSDSPQDAKWLGEGLYRTSLPVSSDADGSEAAEEHFVKLSVPEGFNAIVSTWPVIRRDADGTAQGFDAESGATIIVRHETVENDSSSSCRSDNSLTDGSAEVRGYHTPQATRVHIWADDSGECDMSQWLIGDTVRLAESSGNAGRSSGEVDLQVLVQFEPVVEEAEASAYPTGSMGDAVQGEGEPALRFDNVQPLTGGNSFLTAVEVTPGAYEEKIVPGEMRFYKLPIEWGQRPVVGLRASEAVRENSMEWIDVAITDPFFNKVGSSEIHPVDLEGADNDVAIVTADRPVEFNNRSTNWGGLVTSHAGYYYVGVSMALGETDNIRGVEQPFTIAFGIQGQPTSGPAWRPTYEPGPEPADAPVAFACHSGTVSAPADAASSRAAEPAEGDGSQAQPGVEGSNPHLMGYLIGGGLLLLLALGAGGALVLRNQRKNGA